jgi:hypothetical protein
MSVGDDVRSDILIPTTKNDHEEDPSSAETYSHTPLTNPVLRKNDAVSRIDGETYSRPVVLLQNIRSKIEPMIARPDFLERFYRSQR